MSRYVDKVTYALNLSDKLSKVPKEERQKTLNEVGTYLVEQILENCGRAQTSVANGKWKQKLSDAYLRRKQKESSSSAPNMELTGAMLDALEFKVSGNTVEVGIFDQYEAQKADNHNKFSAASQPTKVPQRQFIPRKNEQFKRDIMNEVNQIIEEAKNG